MAFDYKKEYKDLYQPKRMPAIVTVPAPKAGALPNCAIARYAIKAQEIIINDAGYIACRAYEFKKVLDSLTYERHLYSMMLYND